MWKNMLKCWKNKKSF